MASNEFIGYGINYLTGLNNNAYDDDDLDFDEFNWYRETAGPSQPYVGAEVLWDLNSYPGSLTPNTAPVSLYVDRGVIPGEGYNIPCYQDSTAATFSPQQATTAFDPWAYPSLSPIPTHSPVPTISPIPTFSPTPTLSPVGPFLPPKTHATPTTAYQYPDAQAPAILSPDSLGSGLSPTTRGPILLVVRPSPSHGPCSDGFSSHYDYPATEPFHPNVAPPDPITAVSTPETNPTASGAWSAGPQRTNQTARKERRYDPAKLAKKKAESEKNWNPTLVRFRTYFDTLFIVHNGWPSGGLEPEMALANVGKLVKDDLEKSPLQGKKSGEGERMARSTEDYLKGILRAIRPVEDNTAEAMLSRIADELEGTLEAVSPGAALRRLVYLPEPGKERANRVAAEKERRDRERHHLARISRLFKPRRSWQRKEVLGLAVLFLLYGPGIFPQDFIKVRPTASGS